ncbi:hypothetical protein ACYFX5_18890 [Bremerella sp. T1]|uniref:hypothetical protein n=1 Tax=Bremerella sp. TYQ1 TaxID=3119568 RepID=UPI001CCF8974|nr:hypothetical protein [Bremerella volcania]UBM35115.1 hypothetical protein LA756_20840 [Bremerella volcania]
MNSITRKSDEFLAVPMFVATVAMLSFFALTVQFFMASEANQSEALVNAFLWLTFAMYPIFWLEAAWHFSIDSPRKWQTLYACLLPPLRLARRDMDTGTRMWLPILGWRHIDEDLHEEVERDLSVPMIIVAVAILPLLAIDFIWTRQMEANPWLQLVVETGFSITWLAFTMEFIVMFSIVHKKIDYLKKHWVDLLIICLPLIAFLRVFRMTQILRLQQVTRATRVYRMRGLALRVWRGLLAMDVISRLARVSPEAKIETLRQLIREKQREISNMENEINKLQATIDSAPEKTTATSDLREGEAA